MCVFDTQNVEKGKRCAFLIGKTSKMAEKVVAVAIHLSQTLTFRCDLPQQVSLKRSMVHAQVSRVR